MLRDDQPAGALTVALPAMNDAALPPPSWVAPERGSRAMRNLARELIGWLSLLVCGSLFTAYLAVTGDALARSAWNGVVLEEHLTAGISLYTAIAAALGLLGLAGLVAARSLRTVVQGRSRRLGPLMLPIVVGLLSAWAASSPLASTMAGVVERSSWGSYLERATVICFGLGAMGVAGVVQLAVAAVEQRRFALPVIAGTSLIAAAALLGFIDLTVMVALYASAHAMLEAVATVLSITGAALLIYTAYRAWPATRQVGSWIAAAALGWLLLFSADGEARGKVGSSLAHVWREPGYLGRMLLRLQLTEDFLSNPTRWSGSLDSRVQRLARRFDLSTMAVSPAWDLPREREPADVGAAMRELRGTGGFNLVIFYVDTLRADVAADRSVMPALGSFGDGALRFRRAYSTASDTVDALPVLTGGCWGAVPCQGDLLTFSQRQGMPRTLVIAKSAASFLAKLSPHFAFDEVVDIQDYEEGKPKVWGYGGDRPSAEAVTDETLSWIDRHAEGGPFLMWSFHYDVHNWKELEPAYLERLAADHGIETDVEDPRWRYRAAAAGVDRAFAKMLAGLTARGLDDSTVVLVVSDHGEGLGERGHLRHAVYLWDSLIHVPLLLRVPGVAPRDVDAPVGHVDVAPTLARFIDSRADVSRYHGSDLLHHTLAEPVDNRLPILLMSMRKDDLLRVGLVGREPPYHKMVLPLDSVEPELHDLDRPRPDDVDLARERTRITLSMVSSLVTSPVFPRPEAPEPEDGTGSHASPRRKIAKR